MSSVKYRLTTNSKGATIRRERDGDVEVIGHLEKTEESYDFVSAEGADVSVRDEQAVANFIEQLTEEQDS